MNLIITFTVLSVVNVLFSTYRSIVTINGSKLSASLWNGGYFAFYNIMVIYTVADFPMWQKCLITFACNIIGVYIVKFIEEKMQKEKLWKIETTIEIQHQASVCKMLTEAHIPFNYIEGIGKYVVFNIFCSTKAQSAAVKEILKHYNAKYFVSESKAL